MLRDKQQHDDQEVIRPNSNSGSIAQNLQQETKIKMAQMEVKKSKDEVKRAQLEVVKLYEEVR